MTHEDPNRPDPDPPPEEGTPELPDAGEPAGAPPPEEPGAGPHVPGGPDEPGPSADQRPSLSYWAIVTGQFRRNRPAVWALRIVAVMFILAILAPILSSRIPFLYVDRVRQTLSEGDRVEVGSLTFTVTKKPREEKEQPVEMEEPTGSETREEDAPERGTFYHLRREDTKKEILVVEGLTVGASDEARMTAPDAGLEDVHASFGLFAGRPYVVDEAARRRTWYLKAGDRVEIEGRAFEILQSKDGWFLDGGRGKEARLHAWGVPGTDAPLVVAEGNEDLKETCYAFEIHKGRPVLRLVGGEERVLVDGREVHPADSPFALTAGNRLRVGPDLFTVEQQGDGYVLAPPGEGPRWALKDGLFIGVPRRRLVEGPGGEPSAGFGLHRGRPFVTRFAAEAEVAINGKARGRRTVKVNGECVGETTFPFFSTLFDRNEYEMNVDRFFNFMILGVPILLLLYWLWGRAASRLGIGLARIRLAGAIAAIAVLAGGFALISLKPLSHPYRDYKQEMLRQGARLGTVHPVLRGRHSWGLFPPIRRFYRDQNPDIRLKAPWKDVSRRHALKPFLANDIWIPEPEKKLKLAELGFVAGTDMEGRDVFTRMLYGTRISLTIGVFAVSIYVAIGIFLGGLAGFFGGWVDIILQRFIEIMMCFPSFFLILALIAILENRSIFYIMLIIGVTRWTGVARLVRGEFLKQKTIDYVVAARALGVSKFKIMFKHILPNALSPVLVSATFGIAAAIIIEASLSFLGLGDTRAPSWGQILTAGRVSQEDYLILIPGFAIFFTVTVLNLVGEGTRDALDPKLRQ